MRGEIGGRGMFYTRHSLIVFDWRSPMQQDDKNPKAWSGRFSEPVSELVKRYTRH